MKLLKDKLREEGQDATSALASLHGSVSSQNFEAIGADSRTISNWMRETRDKRPSQTALLQIITNTGCKVFGTQLQCHGCNVELNTKHVLCECPLLSRPRKDAAAYLGRGPACSLDPYRTTRELLPTFCMAAGDELSTLLRTSADKAQRRQSNTAALLDAHRNADG